MIEYVCACTHGEKKKRKLPLNPEKRRNKKISFVSHQRRCSIIKESKITAVSAEKYRTKIFNRHTNTHEIKNEKKKKKRKKTIELHMNLP